MKAHELRIGNYVNRIVVPSMENGRIKPSIDLWRIECTDFCSLENFKPIPLTEQWLIDFWLLQDPNHKCFHIKGMDFDLPIMSGGYHDNEYGLDEENRITLLYVHQLQNLYFALTGQDLHL